MNQLFDAPLTLESLQARIEALEAKILEKPVRQSTEVPPELRQAWSLWTLHKSGSKGWTACAKARQIAKLSELSANDPDMAMALVEQAIERAWTTFFPLKDPPKGKVKVVGPMGAKAALQPTETPLERQLAWIRQQQHYGKIDAAEAARQSEAATERHRGTA